MFLPPVTPILIEEIKQEAYRQKLADGTQYQKALDRISKAKGFRSWCDVNERLKKFDENRAKEIAERTKEFEGRRQVYYIDPGQSWNPDLKKGFIPSWVFEGLDGHYPITNGYPKDPTACPYYWGKTLDEAESSARAMNGRLGLTKQEILDIIMSSMNIRGTEWEASMSIAELTIELSKMIKAENASKTPYDDKSAFLGPNKERVREIGVSLNENGGFAAMQEAFGQLQIIHAFDRPNYLRDLELAWSGIGEWQG